MKWGVEIYLSGRRVRSYLLDVERVLIGRSPDCHIHLPPLMISRHHAELIPEDRGVWVKDLESTNGTYVQETPIKKVFLSENDSFIIGPYRLVIVPAMDPEGFSSVKDQEREEDVIGRKTSSLDKELKERLLSHLEETKVEDS